MPMVIHHGPHSCPGSAHRFSSPEHQSTTIPIDLLLLLLVISYNFVTTPQHMADAAHNADVIVLMLCSDVMPRLYARQPRSSMKVECCQDFHNHAQNPRHKKLD